eukprot:596177_1
MAILPQNTIWRNFVEIAATEVTRFEHASSNGSTRVSANSNEKKSTSRYRDQQATGSAVHSVGISITLKKSAPKKISTRIATVSRCPTKNVFATSRNLWKTPRPRRTDSGDDRRALCDVDGRDGERTANPFKTPVLNLYLDLNHISIFKIQRAADLVADLVANLIADLVADVVVVPVPSTVEPVRDVAVAVRGTVGRSRTVVEIDVVMPDLCLRPELHHDLDCRMICDTRVYTEGVCAISESRAVKRISCSTRKKNIIAREVALTAVAALSLHHVADAEVIHVNDVNLTCCDVNVMSSDANMWRTACDVN